MWTQLKENILLYWTRDHRGHLGDTHGFATGFDLGPSGFGASRLFLSTMFRFGFVKSLTTTTTTTMTATTSAAQPARTSMAAAPLKSSSEPDLQFR